MSDETRKIESVKFAQESAKQIITLSTAVITFLLGAVSLGALELRGRTFWFALFILIFLVVSVVTGIITLFSLSGILSSKQVFDLESPLDSANYKRFGRFQFFSFVAAILLISVFVLIWPKRPESSKIEIKVPFEFSCALSNESVVCKTIAP